jgi:hypothetical protein
MSFEEELNEKKQPIYSKWAILSFCVFFSPIFGGFLLRQNLKDKGLNKVGNIILLASFGLASVTAVLSTTFLRGPGTTFLANFLEGALLVEYVFRSYFPDEETYEKKGIAKPLAISLLVVTLMLLLMFSSGVPLEPQ